jgi:phenylpropionate dioxygenase-like ring-hydroxylating dioxygenase large terminal subunit
MTTREENDLLTRTGPGTPGGDLFRRYWQPVALSEELRDAPLPVKIMGEDLVLFRDGDGKPGLIGLLCPHRCADLSFGRLEPEGIRCLYHGWLFDKHGACLDQPAEPADSHYKDEVKHTAYPCFETGGVILTYMGPGEPPLVPNYHFLHADQNHVFATKVFHDCNQLQANEGNFDPAHLSFLHALNTGRDGRKGVYLEMQAVTGKQTRPKIDTERTRFGMRIYAQRGAGESRKYLRLTNFAMPNIGFFAGDGGRSGPTSYSVHWHVPIDDRQHWRYDFYYDPVNPIDRPRLENKVNTEMGPDYRPERKRSNRYLQDRNQMKGETFAGMGNYFPSHDLFAVETPGQIHDRTREHLGASDIAIVQARRMLLNAMKDVQAGREPPGVVRKESDNIFNDLLVLAVMLDADQDPKTYCAELTASQNYHAMNASGSQKQ